MKLTPDEIKQLENALNTISDIQIKHAKADERLPAGRRSERWRELYHVRAALNDYIWREKKRAANANT